MASQTISATCPHCSKTMKGNTDLLGKRIKCPSCGAPFDIAMPAPPAIVPPPPVEPFASMAGMPVKRRQEMLQIPLVFHLAAWLFIIVVILNCIGVPINSRIIDTRFEFFRF